jgi:hypothetical protein
MSRFAFGSAMLAHKNAIGAALSIIAATATVIVFQSYLELSWIVAIPAAVLAYLTMPVLWARYINSLEQKNAR